MLTFLRVLWLLALPVGLGACLIVEDDSCNEGERICQDDYVEECISNRWEIIADCPSDCGGSCGYDVYGTPLCFCP